MAEKDIEYYRNLTERAGRDFVNRQPDDPFKTVSLPSEVFKRYKGLNVLASDIYGGKEIDNRYSLTQGFLDRTFRDFKVFGANAASMFATTIISLPDLLFNYDTEKSFIENMGDTPMVKSIFEWRKEIEEGNINFNTAVDDETGTWSTIKNTVLPGWMTGSSKGWGELFRSAGYAVGTMGSMFIPGPGTILGNVARLTGAARGVGKFASLTNQVVNRLNNPSLLRNSSSLIDDIVNTSKSLNAAANTIDKFNKIKDVAKFMHRGLMGAYGEAAFEGLESEQAVIDDLTKDFIEKNGYSPYGEDLENIKKIAKEARTANFWMNISMLIFSNSYQMGRLFRHIDAQKETVEAIARKGLKFEVVDGKPQVMARTLQSDWFQKGFGKKIEPFARGLKSLGSPRSIFVESLSEGLEEFTQEAFSNAVNNYAKMRYNTNGKKGVLEALSFIGKGIQDSMTDEGLRSFLSGVMVGGGQQLIQSAIALPSQIRNKGKIIDELNITLANYENFDIKKVGKYMNVDSLRGTIIDKVFDTQAAKNIGDAMDVTTDVKTYKDLEDANFFNLSKPYLMRGHAEILKQQFKYAVENYEGDISEIFNTKSSKQDVIDSFNRKIDDIAQSYNFVSNSFRNPYDPTKSEEEAIKAGMFNNAFIPELAYQHWRLKRLQERKNSLESELGGLYEEFKNTTSEEKIPKLEKQIEKRIKDISEGASTPQTNSAKKYYESSLKHLKEFKELINDEEVDNEQRRKKYNEFMTHYMQAVYSYIGSKPEAFSVDDFQQKVEDLTQILLDLDLVERNVSKYLSGDYFDLVYENYIKATREFLTQSELERIEKVFGDLENYEKYADENYQKYVETGLINEDVFRNLLKTANTTEEELTEKLQELANEEIDRKLEIENFIAEWIKKLSHLKSNTLSEDILDIIKKHASDKNRPKLTKEVLEKVEKELSGKLPLKKGGTTSSGGQVKMISPEEMKKLRDEKRHLESRLDVEELSKEEEESIIKRIDEITAIIVEQSKLYYNKGVNYNGFKSAVNKIKEENSLDEVLNHDDISLIPKNSISLWEIFNKTEFEKLSDPIKVDLLNVFKEYFTEWEKEADTVLKELKKNEPETLNVLGYQIIKFSDNEYVLKIGDENFKFTHFNDALVKIAKEGISNVEEQISSIENKFENRDWNPIPSEDLTLEEKQREEDERNWMIRTLNDMSLNMTEEDMMSDIAENTTVEVWSFDSTDPKFQLDRAKYKNKKTRLPDEKILGSTISDTIRFRYNKDGVTFSYQSIKHPIDSIRFFDKKYIQNEIQANVENENLKVALLLLLNNYNIENLTYYQFLLDASVENSDARRLYELFQIAGFLKFKGSIQEQIKSIEEKQKIFDDIKNTRDISNYSLKRVFDGLQTNPKKQRFNVPIRDVEHPFVMKTDNGTTRSDFVFFRFPDDVTSGQKFNIDFIDPKYRANNEHEKELIGISIESQLKKLPKLYSGYYILFTSSTGTPYIIRLSTKPITRERANEILNDDSISKLDKLRAFSIIDSSYLTGSSQSRAMYFNESKGFVYYNVKYFDENGVEFSHSNSVPDSALTDYDSFIDWINDVNKKLHLGKAKWHKKLPDGTWIKENSDGTAISKPIEAKFIPIEGGSARVPQSTSEVLERYNISQIGTRQFNVDKFVITPKGEKGNKVHTNLIPQTPSPSEPSTSSQTPSSFTEVVSLEELSSSEYSELVKSVLDEAKSINSNITFYDEKYITDWLETNFPNEENKNVLTTFVIYGLIGNLDRNSNIPQELNNDIDKAKLVRAANSPAFAIKQNINNAFQLGKIPLELTVPGTHYKSTPPTTSVEIDVTKEVDYLLSKCS